jgi:hypothetical protein
LVDRADEIRLSTTQRLHDLKPPDLVGLAGLMSLKNASRRCCGIEDEERRGVHPSRALQAINAFEGRLRLSSTTMPARPSIHLADKRRRQNLIDSFQQIGSVASCAPQLPANRSQTLGLSDAGGGRGLGVPRRQEFGPGPVRLQFWILHREHGQADGTLGVVAG